MLVESPSKMARRDLEQTCEQLNDLVEKSSFELERKDQHIKHLTINARNWSKKYHATLGNSDPAEHSSLDSSSSELGISLESNSQQLAVQQALIKSETEKTRVEKLLLRVNASNGDLLEKVKLLQIELKDAKIAQQRLEEKLAAASLDATTQEAESEEKPANDESAVVVLEFSPEMQKLLSKYAA